MFQNRNSHKYTWTSPGERRSTKLTIFW
jgi:hypothetical protein